jgi:ribosomal RNA assembly protein
MVEMWFFAVPPERARSVLRKGGGIRRLMEEHFNVSLAVDEETGGVSVGYTPDKAADAYLGVTKIMSAISTGFDEAQIRDMIERDLSFVALDLEEMVGSQASTLTRIKGRIIGEKGRAKQKIESATGCILSIYGNKVGILGHPETIDVASEAVQRLSRGFQHQTVYRFLESRMRRLKQEHELWKQRGEP